MNAMSCKLAVQMNSFPFDCEIKSLKVCQAENWKMLRNFCSLHGEIDGQKMHLGLK